MEPSPSDPNSPRPFARAVLTQNLGLKKGERVMIEAWTHTLPYAVAFAREARRLGASPLVVYEDEDAYWDSVESKEDNVLGASPAHEWAALGETNAYVFMWGAGDRLRFQRLPEARRDKLNRWNEAWYKAAGKAKIRGVRLEIGRPYPALAGMYGVDEDVWRREVQAASLADPKQLAATAAPLQKALTAGRELHVYDDHGTDVTLRLSGKPPVANLGRPSVDPKASPFARMANVPAGLVRVPLDGATADGTVVANRTSYYEAGKATGGRLRFADGKLVEASFASGGELFDRDFKRGGKGRDRAGYLGIGLNPALHDTPQLEDVEQGAITVSVGGNQFVGGANQSPFFGWVISAGATVEVDGKRIFGPA